MSTASTVVQASLASWQEFVDFADTADGFVFRGQNDATWPLETSLERAVSKFGKRAVTTEQKERAILRDFRSKFHLYAGRIATPESDLDWLALLQHHGCPTRLLDFTLSPYIAAYFALRDATTDCAVWALNQHRLREGVRSAFGLVYDKPATRHDINLLHRQVVNDCLANTPPSRAARRLIPVELVQASERVARQQGSFVVPSTLGKAWTAQPFKSCLTTSLGIDAETLNDLPQSTVADLIQDQALTLNYGLIRLTFPRWMHAQALKHLAHMNMNEESLFPGLDGLARSLAERHLRS